MASTEQTKHTDNEDLSQKLELDLNVQNKVNEEMLRYMEIDNIWRKLGKFGKYQTRQIVFLLLCFPSLAWHVLSIVFIGYVPDFVCNQPGNDTYQFEYGEDKHINTTYEECHITSVYSNGSHERGCVFGYNYSIPRERSVVSEWDLVCNKEVLSGLAQALFIFGQGFGCLAVSVTDIFGRRPTYIISQAVNFGVLCGTAFVQQYWTFAVFRFLSGLLFVMCDLPAWTAILETIPDEHRPFIGALRGIWWALVTALMTPVVYLLRNHSWRTVQLVLSTSNLHFLIAIFIMEESLRWLVVTNRATSAMTLLEKACKMNRVPIESIFTSDNVPDVDLKASPKSRHPEISSYRNKSTEGDSTFQSLIDSNTEENRMRISSTCESGSKNLENEPKTNDKMITMLKDMKLLRQTAIICFTWCAGIKFQRVGTAHANALSPAVVRFDLGNARLQDVEERKDLLGMFVNVLVYYGLFLSSSLMSSDRYVQFFLSAIVEVPGTACSWYIMYRYGRRFGCILGHAVSGVALLCSTVLSSFEDVADSVPALITVLVMIGKFGVSISFICLYTLTPEFFPTTLRNSGMGFASFFGRAAGSITSYSDSLANLASWLPGTIFAATSFATAWLLRYLPETKGRELPQTIADMKKRKKSRRSMQIGD